MRGNFWKKIHKNITTFGEEESYEKFKIFVKDLGRFPAFFFRNCPSELIGSSSVSPTCNRIPM
jgi:hypothetical protein